MADISGAATATKEYISNVKSASDQLTQFSAVQTSAVELGGKFAENCAKLNNSIASQADQSEQLSKNIGAVNAAYQTQLQGINSQIKSTETLVNGLSSISAEIVASVEGVKEYRAQVANLSKTVGELNSIYGNMLSAVTNR
jgi:gliding motility-associated protein GldL